MKKILYSTNVYLKLLIQEKYFDDKHFIWCSEYFDGDAEHKYSEGKLIAPSSNPSSIYKELIRDIKGKDKHSAKITEQKASFTARAIESYEKGVITELDKDEIIFMVDDAEFEFWRPLLYIIPSDPIKNKISIVPIQQRAGFGKEYIIKNLLRSEFDIVEL